MGAMSEEVSEEVYDVKKETHRIITWAKTDDEEYYNCETNESIHHIVDTDHGLLVRFLGDSYSQLIPQGRIGGRSGMKLLYYIERFLS